MLLIRNMWLDMKRILRIARHIINAELEPYNLSSAEGDILFLLLTGSNNFQQEQLAEQLDIGRAAVSRVIDSLESKGYVMRVREQGDRRAYSVSLADRAISAGADIVGIYNYLYKLVRKGITDEEFVSIESLLCRISANLQSLGDDSVLRE